jgi:hypothetical protein
MQHEEQPARREFLTTLGAGAALGLAGAAAAADGHLELYKSTMRYEGNEGRAQHGFPPPKELPL